MEGAGWPHRALYGPEFEQEEVTLLRFQLHAKDKYKMEENPLKKLRKVAPETSWNHQRDFEGEDWDKQG